MKRKFLALLLAGSMTVSLCVPSYGAEVSFVPEEETSSVNETSQTEMSATEDTDAGTTEATESSSAETAGEAGETDAFTAEETKDEAAAAVTSGTSYTEEPPRPQTHPFPRQRKPQR